MSSMESFTFHAEAVHGDCCRMTSHLGAQCTITIGIGALMACGRNSMILYANRCADMKAELCNRVPGSLTVRPSRPLKKGVSWL